MLNKFTELLPLFIVRWLAVRYCERIPYAYEGLKDCLQFHDPTY